MPLGFASSIFSTVAEAEAGTTRDPYDLTNGGSVVFSTTAKFGSHSAEFDGSSGNSLYNNSKLDPDDADGYHTGAYTIECFWRPNTQSETVAILTSRNGGYGGRDYQFLYRTDNKVQVGIKGWNGSDPIENVFNFTTSGTYSTGTWHHLAAGYDGSGNSAFWINGSRVANSTHTYSNNMINFTRFAAGANNHVGTANEYKGYIDEIRISSIDRYGVSNTSITVPTGAFTNDSDTFMLHHLNNSLTDDNAA